MHIAVYLRGGQVLRLRPTDGLFAKLSDAMRNATEKAVLDAYNPDGGTVRFRPAEAIAIENREDRPHVV